MVVTPAEAVEPIFGETSGLYWRALKATAWSAFRGLLIGGSLAFAAALIAAGVPFLRRSITRLAAIANAAPWVAVAPCLIIILGKGQGPTAVAALAVFFFVFISTTVGLSAAPAAVHDVASVLGASRFQRMWLVQLPGGVALHRRRAQAGRTGGAGRRHLRGVVRRPAWARRAADHRHAVGPAPAAVGRLAAQRHASGCSPSRSSACSRIALAKRFGSTIAESPERPRAKSNRFAVMAAEVVAFAGLGIVLVTIWWAWIEMGDIAGIVVPQAIVGVGGHLLVAR